MVIKCAETLSQNAHIVTLCAVVTKCALQTPVFLFLFSMWNVQCTVLILDELDLIVQKQVTCLGTGFCQCDGYCVHFQI